MRRRVILLMAFPVWLLAGQAALAGPEVTEGLRACAGIVPSAERLDCYDRLADGIVETGGSLASPVVPPVGEPAHAPAPAPFGTATRVQPQPIESRLHNLDRTARGLHRFTLENQQVWLEVTPGRGGFRAGVPVRIEPTPMGSFVLVDDAGRSTRVRRVE